MNQNSGNAPGSILSLIRGPLAVRQREPTTLAVAPPTGCDPAYWIYLLLTASVAGATRRVSARVSVSRRFGEKDFIENESF